jgi:curved DNA-binding protein CbpA
MKSPYEILGLVHDANDGEIKQAYLRKVKAHPPESDPENFQVIHQVYQAVKDAKSRLQFELFNLPEACFDDMLDHAFSREDNTALTADQLLKLLRASIDDKVFQTVLMQRTRQS